MLLLFLWQPYNPGSDQTTLNRNNCRERNTARGTQRPTHSKHDKNVKNPFLYALEVCFINLELP